MSTNLEEDDTLLYEEIVEENKNYSNAPFASVCCRVSKELNLISI